MPLLNIPQHSDSYIGEREREEEEEKGEREEEEEKGEREEGGGEGRVRNTWKGIYQVKVDGFSWKREMSNTTKHS